MKDLAEMSGADFAQLEDEAHQEADVLIDQLTPLIKNDRVTNDAIRLCIQTSLSGIDHPHQRRVILDRLFEWSNDHESLVRRRVNFVSRSLVAEFCHVMSSTRPQLTHKEEAHARSISRLIPRYVVVSRLVLELMRENKE